MTEFRPLTLHELLIDNGCIPSLPFSAVSHKPNVHLTALMHISFVHLTAPMRIRLGMPSHAQAFIQEVMLCNSNMPIFPVVPF